MGLKSFTQKWNNAIKNRANRFSGCLSKLSHHAWATAVVIFSETYVKSEFLYHRVTRKGSHDEEQLGNWTAYLDEVGFEPRTFKIIILKTTFVIRGIYCLMVDGMMMQIPKLNSIFLFLLLSHSLSCSLFRSSSLSQRKSIMKCFKLLQVFEKNLILAKSLNCCHKEYKL